VNLAWTVVIVMAFGWTLVSILVAVAFGGMAGGRDTPSDLADTDLADLADRAARIAGAAGRTTPPIHDDGYRTAV
jgi:hypothetical protein